MTSEFQYPIPVDQTRWTVNGRPDMCFSWSYDQHRESLLALYEKSKRRQWDAALRLDWSQPVDETNPMGLDDASIPIFGMPIWKRLSEKEKGEIRIHSQAYMISQFMHGEQGALIATARIVQSAPDLDAKFFAATQAMDEARHLEVYSRFLRERFPVAYPISAGLRGLLDNGLSDARWDMTYLTMQVLIEGLALAAFQRIRDMARNTLSASLNAYVMQDEARHVAFGRVALRDYYRNLTDAELDEREAFLIEGCHQMLQSCSQREVWEAFGLPLKECLGLEEQSESGRQFHTSLFSRIVPIVKGVGLWGPRVREAFEAMGVLEMADFDLDSQTRHDDEIADRFDAEAYVERGLAAAPAPAGPRGEQTPPQAPRG
ncbi:ferritin-like domain-containing protein [Burkholderia gladioli]|uniref:ferritin-like domain-containing protein n=1 Tax=Burkholderia gladioli TaxID=28095 RepID=UPI00163F13E2|nr:ferritin-like domain-containing protein [Burkholderia gladioli]